jgi:hypothetical protein
MTYEIAKQITIHHKTDDWEYVFTNDEYGTVCVHYTEGMEAMTGETKTIHIPKDCIQNFIDVLEQFK